MCVYMHPLLFDTPSSPLISPHPQMTVWGSFATSADLKNPGSGIGQVRNSYMYDHIQKAVVYTPFLSSMHAQPFTLKATSVAAARSAVGLHTTGVLGMFKGLWRRASGAV